MENWFENLSHRVIYK